MVGAGRCARAIFRNPFCYAFWAIQPGKISALRAN